MNTDILEGITHIIFDLDNTLVQMGSLDPMPSVIDYLEEFKGSGIQTAVATNQGGVGLRHWMITGEWGEPNRLPTKEDVDDRLEAVQDKLNLGNSMMVASYAYMSKKLLWSPVPDNVSDAQRWRWEPYSRKPNAGMIHYIMDKWKVVSDQVLFVGDQLTDELAAKNARCKFAWAWDVFGLDHLQACAEWRVQKDSYRLGMYKDMLLLHHPPESIEDYRKRLVRVVLDSERQLEDLGSRLLSKHQQQFGDDIPF